MTHVTHLTKTIFALAVGALLFTGAYAVSQAQETGQAPQEDRAAMQDMEDCPMMQNEEPSEESSAGQDSGPENSRG